MFIYQQIENGRKLKVSFLTDRMARIQCGPEYLELKESPLNRYQFIQEPNEEVEVKQEKSELGTRLKSSCLTLDVTGDGLISAERADGKRLFSMCGLDLAEKKAQAVFKAQPAEDWIGFGDQTRERLFHRGTKAVCWVCNVTSYIPIPFFMSTLRDTSSE